MKNIFQIIKLHVHCLRSSSVHPNCKCWRFTPGLCVSILESFQQGMKLQSLGHGSYPVFHVYRKSCYTNTPDLEKISRSVLLSNLHVRCQMLGIGNRNCEGMIKMSLYLVQEAWNGPREDSLACLVTRSARLNRKNKLKKLSWLWSIKVVVGSYNF